MSKNTALPPVVPATALKSPEDAWKTAQNWLYFKLFLAVLFFGMLIFQMFLMQLPLAGRISGRTLADPFMSMRLASWIAGVIPVCSCAVIVLLKKPVQSYKTMLIAAIAGALAALLQLALHWLIAGRGLVLPVTPGIVFYTIAGAGAGAVCSLFFPNAQKIACLREQSLLRFQIQQTGSEAVTVTENPPAAAMQAWKRERSRLYTKYLLITFFFGPQLGLFVYALPSGAGIFHIFSPFFVMFAWYYGIVPAMTFAVILKLWKPALSILSTILCTGLGALIGLLWSFWLGTFIYNSSGLFELAMFTSSSAGAAFIISLFLPRKQELAAVRTVIFNQYAAAGELIENSPAAPAVSVTAGGADPFWKVYAATIFAWPLLAVLAAAVLTQSVDVPAGRNIGETIFTWLVAIAGAWAIGIVPAILAGNIPYRRRFTRSFSSSLQAAAFGALALAVPVYIIWAALARSFTFQWMEIILGAAAASGAFASAVMSLFFPRKEILPAAAGSVNHY